MSDSIKAEILNQELSFSPERISDEQFYGLLNGVANHEAKLITTAVVLSQPGRWFNQNDIFREIIDRQGSPLGWRPSQNVPWQYCYASLAPIGAVVVGKNEKDQTAYRANETNSEFNMAAAGFLLEWSLKNRDISLQTVFGATTSKGGVRSPETRYQIYLDLFTRPREEASEVEIYTSLEGLGYRDKVSLNRQLHAMENRGLVSMRSKFTGPDAEETITINKTLISFNPEVSEQVRELCYGLEHLKAGYNFEYYKELAKQIITDESKVKYLMQKAKNTSPFFIGHSQGGETLLEDVLSTVKALGNVSVKSVRGHLETEYKRSLSIDHVRAILNQLVKAGRINSHFEQQSQDVKRKIKIYSIES